MLFFRATGALSTEKWIPPKLLSVGAQIHTESHTWFFAAQVFVNIEKNAVVHKNRLALLLLLFFNNTIKEQLINIQNTPAAGLWKRDVPCPLHALPLDTGAPQMATLRVRRSWACAVHSACRTICTPWWGRQSSSEVEGVDTAHVTSAQGRMRSKTCGWSCCTFRTVHRLHSPPKGPAQGTL